MFFSIQGCKNRHRRIVASEAIWGNNCWLGTLQIDYRVIQKTYTNSDNVENPQTKERHNHEVKQLYGTYTRCTKRLILQWDWQNHNCGINYAEILYRCSWLTFPIMASTRSWTCHILSSMGDVRSGFFLHSSIISKK